MHVVGLILLSVSSMVLQNGLFNFITKKKLKNALDINSFNIFIYSVCALTFGILMLIGSVSVYTVGLGLLFGIVTAFSNYYKLLALSCGPMHLTLLFTTSSMIIPTMSGVFFGENFSIAKLLIAFVLVGFLYLSFEKTGNAAIGGKWFMFCVLAFLLQGTIGLLQKIHQSSVYKDETGAFLFVAFVCALVYSFIRTKGAFHPSRLGKKQVIIGLVCGACTFAMNFINLKLSGQLPSQLFFPLVNGSAIVLTSLMSLLVFKEKLSNKQRIGLVGGILSLIAICLVP
jgi:multidrug transporter EmrE-like cation transporter